LRYNVDPMHFVDECELRVEAGNGGSGAIAFRREKNMPLGGPAGGDGGNGGSVVFVVDSGMGTLFDLKHQRTLRAPHGENGGGKDCYGRAGADLVVRVPPGTVVIDRATGECLYEMTRADQREVIAKGGHGGRGNLHFATPSERAPRHAEPGTPGEKRDLRLELQVMADVGLLGFPNVGKSTFIRAVSRARPKVADYPFTTLEPHLGVVTLGEKRAGLGRHFVVADIPGLLPGASRGVGLGSRFLRHVERTRVLLHLITLDASPDREPLADYDALRVELAAFNPKLTRHPEIVALSKADLPDVREAYPELKKRFAKRGIELRLLSSATHEGLEPLVKKMAEILDQSSAGEAAESQEDAGSPLKTRKTRTTKTKPVGKKPQATKTPKKGKPLKRGKPTGRKAAAAKRRAKRR
jgi:GTP-binding protein